MSPSPALVISGNGPDYFGAEIRCKICLKLKVNLANYHPPLSAADVPPNIFKFKSTLLSLSLSLSLSRPVVVSPVLSQTESDGQHHDLSPGACSNCSQNILESSDNPDTPTAFPTT